MDVRSQSGNLHADARLLAPRFELGGTGDIAAKGTWQVGVIPGDKLHPATERELQHWREHFFLAVLGE